MTLKEKLCEPFGGLRTETVNQLEIIADDFAIGSVDWANENAYKFPTNTTTAELLEIYKKENQL